MKLETAPVLALVGGVIAIGGVVFDKTMPSKTRDMTLMHIVVFATGVSVAGLIVWGLKK